MWWRNCDDITLIRFDTISERDGQTGRQNSYINISIAVLTRDKTYKTFIVEIILNVFVSVLISRKDIAFLTTSKSFD